MAYVVSERRIMWNYCLVLRLLIRPPRPLDLADISLRATDLSPLPSRPSGAADLQTLGNRRHVQQAQDQVKQAHMDYCAAVHTDIQVGPDGRR